MANLLARECVQAYGDASQSQRDESYCSAGAPMVEICIMQHAATTGRMGVAVLSLAELLLMGCTNYLHVPAEAWPCARECHVRHVSCLNQCDEDSGRPRLIEGVRESLCSK